MFLNTTGSRSSYQLPRFILTVGTTLQSIIHSLSHDNGRTHTRTESSLSHPYSFFVPRQRTHAHTHGIIIESSTHQHSIMDSPHKHSLTALISSFLSNIIHMHHHMNYDYEPILIVIINIYHLSQTFTYTCHRISTVRSHRQDLTISRHTTTHRRHH